MKKLTFTNKKGQVVTIGYREIAEKEYSNKGKLKNFIDHLIIDGVWFRFAIYTTSESEKEIKSTALRIMRDRKAYIANNTK